MRVLAFTGMPGSGKTEAVRLAREAGLPVIRMGDFVMLELEARGLPPEERHIGPIATGMRAEHGADVWAARTTEAILDPDNDTVPHDAPVLVIDGVRSFAEITRFRRDLGDGFTLIAITAPETLRHARILGRGRGDDAATLADVQARDARERGWGIEDAIAAADETVLNDDGLGPFQAAVRDALRRHGAHP